MSMVCVSWLVALTISVANNPFVRGEDDIPDLQIHGEWWFTALLDAEFPHDDLKPLKAGDVVPEPFSEGSQLFKVLPEADYVLLEFFAPWCPHCQHFAPEMVKVAKLLEYTKPCGTCTPLVSLRVVDCERLDMKPVCDWGQAWMFPKLLLAPRDELLKPLKRSSNHTAGAHSLVKVSEASEVVSWLSKKVPGWPAGLPAPKPRPKDEPFFGWAQPPVGVQEPASAPTRDLEVGAASLLHQAFVTLGRSDEGTTKEALFNLLDLFCASWTASAETSSNHACRQSACRMRERLSQNWDFFIIDGGLDWKSVEQGNLWCEKPWPTYAEKGWDWCQGRTPGTRGFSCALWMVFHSLLAGAVLRPEAISVLSKPPLQIVRQTVQVFFNCKDCRDHFLAVPVGNDDLKSSKNQALWLWKVHNMATARISEEELSHSALAPPRVPWPTEAACPRCRTADGSWHTDEVFNHLMSFYDGHEDQIDQIGIDGLMSKYDDKPMQPIVVNVFYFVVCPHCLEAIHLLVQPLINARLPADILQVSVLPLYPPLLQLDQKEHCAEFPPCQLALTPMCALKGPMPAPADSHQLVQAINFAACDILNTVGGAEPSESARENCAHKYGLQWDGEQGLRACSEGDEGFSLLRSRLHTHLMKAMEHLHDHEGFQDPPSMPWIMLNGKFLDCHSDGSSCSIATPAGDEQPGGSLLEMVCSKISEPKPPGCQNPAELLRAAHDILRRSLERTGHDVSTPGADCENCRFNLGTFTWKSRLLEGSPVISCVAASALLFAMLFILRRRHWVQRGAASWEQDVVLLPE